MKKLLCSLLFAATAASHAAIVVDASPTGTLDTATWTNSSISQNFLVQFTLGTNTSLTGFDVFGYSPFASVGQSVVVKIRSDVAGAPAASNLFQFNDQIDSESVFSPIIDISSIDFDPIALTAGTYWMGVSGLDSFMTWATYNNGGVVAPTDQRRLIADTVVSTPGFYDLAYRILGEAQVASNDVPEPTSLALMGLGLVALVARRRKK